MAWYCDTSALAKLVQEETESAALGAAIIAGGWRLISSELALAELVRAGRRAGAEHAAKARSLFDDRLDLIRLDRGLLAQAAELGTPWLRTLDAIHLASALALEDACEGVITYDARMQEAAAEVGLVVQAPGQG